MKHQEEDFEYFDDCPICQAMKAGKANTLEELKQAFQKAKEQGSYVGGEWFDKEDKR